MNNALPDTATSETTSAPLVVRAGDLIVVAGDLRQALELAELAIAVAEQSDDTGRQTRTILRMKTVLAGLRR